MAKHKSLELRDVGPVRQISIPIPAGGGVVEITGPNGAGKSECLNAVVALTTGNGKAIPVRDGAPGALVEGLGARLTIGRRTAHAGEFELRALDGPDPSILVDPGIKDRAAAHAERSRALCQLAHAEVHPEAFVGLLGGPDEFARIVKPESMTKGNVPDVAAAVKRDIELAARTAEAQANNLQTEARGIASAAQDVPETEAPDERALQVELEGASASLGELRGRQSQADELRRSAERARETLATFGDKGTKEAGQAAESALLLAKADTAAAADHTQGTDLSVTAAREALSAAERSDQEAKARLREAATAEKAAAKAVDQAFQDFTRRKQLAQAVTAAEAAADVDPEQVAALEQRQSTARVALQRAEVVRRAMEQRARAKGKADQAGEALSRALALRDAARGCEQIVTDALAKVCPSGMRVEGGFLVVDTDRGVELFDELSQGERWKWALDIASRTIAAPGVLVCRQEGWESLQPKVKLEVATMARERGIVIVTARATDDPISASVIGEEPAGQEQAA